MITSVKIVKPDSYGGNDDSTLDWYVEVVFHDGTFVALNEEELKNAAVLAEKGCLS